MAEQLDHEARAKLAREILDGAPKFQALLLKAGMKGSAKHFEGALLKIMTMERLHLEKVAKYQKPKMKRVAAEKAKAETAKGEAKK